MHTGISIRSASYGDAEGISGLICAVAREVILPDFSAAGRTYFLADHGPETIIRRMQDGYRYAVAEAPASEHTTGALAGVVGTCDDNHLYHLFVARPWRGTGLGRELWEHAKALCIAGDNDGWFTVNASRYAVDIYERFGFVATSSAVERHGVIIYPMRLRLRAR